MTLLVTTSQEHLDRQERIIAYLLGVIGGWLGTEKADKVYADAVATAKRYEVKP